MEKSLKNKVVLITGSSIGIGAETAYLFAKERCKVIITYYKDKEEADKVRLKCKGLGASEVLVLPLNIMDDKSISNCVEETVKKFTFIDILLNNAGIVVWKHFKDQSKKEIEEQLRVNLEGLIKMTKESLPYIKDAIVNISSGAGLEGYETLTTYCATKFGVRGFTQALALELPNIKLYSINPGTTATRMNDFKGLPPIEVAKIILNAVMGKYKVPSGGGINVWEVLGE